MTTKYAGNGEFKVKYKKVAPDGGWGYMIGIGMMLPMICAFGILPSFGLLFGDFLKQFGNETSSITLIMGTSLSAFSFAGLFTNTLVKRYSLQSVGIFGGWLLFISWILMIFVTTPFQLLFTYGIVGGFAFGLIISTSFGIFNSYFVKRRVMAISVVQTFVGVGIMVWPLLVEFLLEKYGFRGCIAILAAISGHSVLGMFLMQPVELHYKFVERNDYDICAQDDYKDVRTDEEMASQKELDEKTNISKDGEGKWKTIVNHLDLSLLKDLVYINIVLGVSLIAYADMAFTTIQPLYLLFLNFSNQEIAYIISIGSAADVVSRVALAVYSSFVKISSRTLFMAAAVATVAARIAYLYVDSFTGLVIVSVLLGIMRTYIHIPTPIIFAEYLPPNRFPSGFGLFLFMQGNFCFLISPIVGWIRDVTQSFPIAFHCLTIFSALSVVLWTAEMFIVKCKKSVKTSNDSNT